MSTRFSVRMTCALLAGVAATVGFATPVVAQSSDLSSSFSTPSTSKAPKPADKPSEKPSEKPTSEAPEPPASDINKKSAHILGKDYIAKTECEGRDVMLTVEFTAPESGFYHVVLHDMYSPQEKPLVVVDRWVEKGDKVTFKGKAPQRRPLALVSTRLEDRNYSPVIGTDSLGAGPCVYPGKEF